MWMATCTHLAPKTLYQGRKHHNMQTLSAVSGQLSAVVHFAQGATPLERFHRSKNTTIYTVFVLRILLAPLLLLLIPSLCTTYTHHGPCSTTTYIRHPLCLRSASINTHYFSDLTSRFIRHTLHFRGSIPTTVYTLSARTPE